jgi:hypothetical protein
MRRALWRDLSSILLAQLRVVILIGCNLPQRHRGYPANYQGRDLFSYESELDARRASNKPDMASAICTTSSTCKQAAWGPIASASTERWL